VTGGATTSIHVIRRDTAFDFPNITATGGWKVVSVDQVADDEWQVSIAADENELERVVYGELRLEGKWRGRAMSIPLTAVPLDR